MSDGGEHRTASRKASLAAMLCLWGGPGVPVLAAGDVPSDPYITEVWQATEGLPGNSVTSVAQTPDGYLWVGTDNGLARFDGVRFEVFDASTTGLEHGQIRRLFVDRIGRLWVAMDQGHLSFYEAGRFTPFHPGDRGSRGSVAALAGVGADDVRIIDDAGVLQAFREGHFTEVPWVARPGDEALHNWVLDAAGCPWALNAERQLHVRRGADWTPCVPVGDLAPPVVEHMAGGREAGLWVFDGERFRLLDGGRWTQQIAGIPLPALESITCLREDSSGNLWVGTSGSRLFRLGRNGSQLAFSPGSGFPSGVISDLCEDREGNVWVASRASGLIRLKRSVFRTFGPAEGLPPAPLLCLAEDATGRLMLGTRDGGAFMLENGRYLGPLALLGAPGSVRALRPGRSGAMWVGNGEGLLKLHGPDSARWGVPDGLTHPGILSLHEDREGGLWIGTEAGLGRLDGKRFTSYTTADGLCGNAVQAIAQDEAGDLWFGTAAGLSRFSGGRFVSFSRQDGLPSERVHTLLAGKSGDLWIGTFDGGLSRLRDGHFINYTLQQGLPDNSVRVILDDGLGWLWLGTGRGICRVSHEELDAVAGGSRSRLECVTYLKRDGLASIQCSAGNPSGVKAHDGRLWFATVRGVSVVDPARLAANRISPPVVIEQVTADGGVLFSNRGPNDTGGRTEPAAVRVPAGRRHLEIAYTALSLTSPEQTRFRIRLEGLSERWSEVGTLRVAHYHGLSPGAYRLNVVAANNDGVWSESPAVLALTVTPFYWQTAWFRGVVGTGLAAVLLLGFRRWIVRWERERVAEAVRLQSAALGCAGDGILITDRAGAIVWANRAFAELTGYEDGELAGQNARLLKSGRHPAEFYAAMWQTLLGGEVWQKEIINRKKDGTLSTYDQTATPVRNRQGTITHFIAILRDITERKWMEQALRDSEDRFRTLAVATLEGVIIHEGFQILDANRAAAQMFGFTPAEFKRHSVLELVEPASRALVEDHIVSGREQPLDCQGHRKDGSLFDLEIHGRACPFQGRMVRMAAVRDLTETRQRDQKIRLLEQHEAMEAERGRIARDMHDEMGASLTRITLLSEAAELELAREGPSNQPGALTRLQRIATLGRSLIATMDEIVWAVNPGNDTLEAFASYLCHFCPEFLKPAGIQCRLKMPVVLRDGSLDSRVRHHLFLTVKEALHNVVKHSRATQAVLKLTLEEDAMVITIADDGVGFDLPANTRSGNGLGNMQQRMSQIGGDMKFTSQPGQGTRIVLRVDLTHGGIA